jgi:hypothetical protein
VACLRFFAAKVVQSSESSVEDSKGECLQFEMTGINVKGNFNDCFEERPWWREGGCTIHLSEHAAAWWGVLACIYHMPALSLRIAQRTRAHFAPQHWLLCHLLVRARVHPDITMESFLAADDHDSSVAEVCASFSLVTERPLFLRCVRGQSAEMAASAQGWGLRPSDYNRET